jgi:hypothetical protein
VLADPRSGAAVTGEVALLDQLGVDVGDGVPRDAEVGGERPGRRQSGSGGEPS